jgi:hypothetical protein
MKIGKCSCGIQDWQIEEISIVAEKHVIETVIKCRLCNRLYTLKGKPKVGDLKKHEN